MESLSIYRANLTGEFQIVFKVREWNRVFVVEKINTLPDGKGGVVFQNVDMLEQMGPKIGTAPAFNNVSGFINAQGIGVVEIYS